MMLMGTPVAVTYSARLLESARNRPVALLAFFLSVAELLGLVWLCLLVMSA